MCAGPGHYHLSCYQATVTPAQADAAKKECLAVASKPECAGTVKTSGSGMAGCPTYITYSFANKACHDAYQAAEKATPGCAMYTAYGLGKPENRATTTSKSDYPCA
ncbi:uncharacterized protein HaLaN_22308 [Haematococcus lacustris]|uniref:Uncharacterized protein n=1 Tax=Haematococcus lacustris TaxID=44745 RepID=A0A699ZTJ4_HAELA|nr:uncharacterized protein HaLaN_22308 [Haematococcus lacustris]